MKMKSIREMVSDELWDEIQDKLANEYERISERSIGSIILREDLECDIGSDFADYYLIPTAMLSTVIEETYPFIRRKNIEFNPWTSKLIDCGISKKMCIESIEVRGCEKLSDSQKEVIEAIRDDLMKIYDDLDVEIRVSIEELSEEEEEDYGEEYVQIDDIY